MSAYEKLQPPVRVGFVLALLVSAAVHAAALVASGFVPYAEAGRAARGGDGSELVFELRLRPDRGTPVSALEPEPSTATTEPAPPASADPLGPDSDPFAVDAEPWSMSAPAPDASEEPRATTASNPGALAGEREPVEALEGSVPHAPVVPFAQGAEDARPDARTPESADPLHPARRLADADVGRARDAPPSALAQAPSATTPAGPSGAAVAGTARPIGGSRVASLLENPRPAYPSASRRLGEEGEVVCLIHVRADGAVEHVEVLRSSGFTRLDRAATAGLKRWRFTPALENGVAVATTVRHKVTFVVE